jgi:hypothetical protein
MAQRVPYQATAVRPSWPDLPDHVREAVTGWVGSPVAWRSAGGGFTRGFASTLVTADGRRSFVKAVPVTNQVIVGSYRREIVVHSVLPTAVPAPRLLHSGEVGSGEDTWVVLVLEHVDGSMPGNPWTPGELEVTIASLEQMADALRAVVWDDPLALADEAATPEVAQLWERYDGSALPAGLPEWLDRHRSRLAAATARAPEAFRSDEWAHTDVRADNLLVDGERGWVVDWNWLCHGPAWIDLGFLLPAVHADGVDLASAYASPLLARVPDDDLDTGIAWLGAFFLHSSGQPTAEGGSPWIRAHQLWSGEACLALLRSRWGS